MADALDTLRTAVAPTGDISAITLLGTEGPVDDINEATHIRFDLPEGPVTFPSSQPTRLATTLTSAQDGTAQSKPDGLLPLHVLVFAIKTKDETSGNYARLRAKAKGPRLELVHRSEIIDYLTGKRPTWEGVVSSPASAETAPESSTTPPASPTQDPKEKYSDPAAKPQRKTTSAVKRTYVPDEEDKAFCKKMRAEVEMVPRNRNDAAHGTIYWAQAADFSHFRASIAERLEAMQKHVTGTSEDPARHHNTTQQPLRGPAWRQRAQAPVILLSNSPTALVNMFNVKQLLEDGVFVHPDQARREARGIAETVVTLSHTMSFARSTVPGQPPKPTRFLVVDNVDALYKLAAPFRAGMDASPWKRVAAIFTTGQTWQFKTYEERDPKRLFQQHLGLYARYHNEQRQENIPLWHVRELVIDRHQRHTDKQVAAGFWRLIEHNMQMRS